MMRVETTMTYPSDDNPVKVNQLALSIPLDERVAYEKKIKEEMLTKPKSDHKHYKRKIRELFSDEEWKSLYEVKKNGRT